MPDPRATPAMQQYARFKAKNPDAVLLFRIGDFYEMFDDDAVKVSKAIGLTLTQRTEGVPMAGMPFHQLETYLRKLINAGFRVAVCEQVEEATSKTAKDRGIVARAITRVLTPGTLVDESLLAHDSPQCLAAIMFTESGNGPHTAATLSVLDVSTGSFLLLDGAFETVRDELARRGVCELLYPEPSDGKVPPRIKGLVDGLSISATARPPWQFRMDEAVRVLSEHFGVKSLAGFGLKEDDVALGPAAAVLTYVKQTQTTANDEAIRNAPAFVAPSLSHIQPPRREDLGATCILDAVTLRSLEVEKTMRAGAVDGSLLGVFLSSGGGQTAMGKRLLRDWLVRPLRKREEIELRQTAVQTFVLETRVMQETEKCLARIQDVARIAGRVSLRRATPRDLVALAKSVMASADLATTLAGATALEKYQAMLEALTHKLGALAEEISHFCIEEPPNHLRDGGLIRDGVDPELDEARLLQRDAGAWLAKYQEELTTKFNLPNLKVGYNKITGYYIELPTAQSKNAPPELKRMQTLKNAERYMTPELREFENKVLSAEARAMERERQLFEAMCEKAVAQAQVSIELSDCIATIDCLAAFARTATKLNWKRPEVVDQPVMKIEQGRHPVLDKTLGSTFVPNDCALGCAEKEAEGNSGPGASLALITGPNMAGKSTYIRMVALITLLAHAGSFVPADAAVIGITDRIFTRVGADDALHSGQSTFMVEMTETANIVNHATDRSLVILDEIGRGTSTLDGLSLAWAVAEYLGGEGDGIQKITPRTLFATHYHEITDLQDRLPGRVKNLHVAVREWGDQIVFIHRILPGRTDQSYGIHVAKLAGIPQTVIARAREVLSSLQVTHAIDGTVSGGVRPDTAKIPTKKETEQLSLFKEFVPHPAVDSLKELKIDSMTPLQAFDALRKLQTIVIDN